MKIDILSIIKGHIITLYNNRTGRVSIQDILLFYLIPILLSTYMYHYGKIFDGNAYNISITFFGIFIALILNIQVAIFSIFQRKWDASSDARINKLIEEKLENRRKLLIELNVNLSYLVLVCCAALIISLLSYIQSINSRFISFVVVFLYTHFILTLLMVVKRAHALFDKEYRHSPE